MLLTVIGREVVFSGLIDPEKIQGRHRVPIDPQAGLAQFDPAFRETVLDELSGLDVMLRRAQLAGRHLKHLQPGTCSLGLEHSDALPRSALQDRAAEAGSLKRFELIFFDMDATGPPQQPVDQFARFVLAVRGGLTVAFGKLGLQVTLLLGNVPFQWPLLDPTFFVVVLGIVRPTLAFDATLNVANRPRALGKSGGNIDLFNSTVLDEARHGAQTRVDPGLDVGRGKDVLYGRSTFADKLNEPAFSSVDIVP